MFTPRFLTGVVFLLCAFSVTIVTAAPPTPIPGVVCKGTHLVIGLNEGGGFGVGQENQPNWAGFQFPPGPRHESLAIFFWGEGWKVSYKERERDRIIDSTAWWQPEVGWPPPAANNFKPVSATQVRDDDQACVYEVVVRTTDGRLQLTFDFVFRKAYPSVIVTTTVQNMSPQEVFDIVYARLADYDIHQNTSNGWSSNDNAAFACGNNPNAGTRLVVMSIAGFADQACENAAEVFYSEEHAWDDMSIRGPGPLIVKNRTPSVRDGNGSVHYHLGAMQRKETKQVATVYSAAFTDNCPSGSGGPIIVGPTFPDFGALDADESGVLSQGEVALAGLDMSRLDLRRDGSLDQQEFRLVLAHRLPTFAESDTDKDGLVSQGEAAAIRGLNFGMADQNRDGQLDREEYDAALLKR